MHEEQNGSPLRNWGSSIPEWDQCAAAAGRSAALKDKHSAKLILTYKSLANILFMSERGKP